MGTRADFYDPTMRWLGSLAWDGEPEALPKGVLWAPTLAEYRNNLAKLFEDRVEVVTLPEEGWPWPWGDSRTTDFSYKFWRNKVIHCRFGFNADGPVHTRVDWDFPKHGGRKPAVIFSARRSGIILHEEHEVFTQLPECELHGPMPYFRRKGKPYCRRCEGDLVDEEIF